jgi:hypothetical protein
VERSRAPGRLARAAHLLELAAARLAVLTSGADHPRAGDARVWLRSARSQVVLAGGALGRDGRLALSMLVLGGTVWAVAAVLHDVLGLPGGWTVAITLPVVLFGLAFPLSRLIRAVDRWTGQRRTAWPPAAPAVTPPPGVGTAGETLALLRLARRDLATLMRDRSGEGASAGAFDRLRRRDLRLAALSAADRDICVTIHSLEVWLSATERAARTEDEDHG